jgi:hypothetical protein
MRYLSLIIFIFLQLFLNAQGTFIKQIGTKCEDEGLSVLQTYDNGYIINAHTYISGKYYTWLIRTKENGDTLWTRTYSNGMLKGSSDHTLIQCTDSGFAVIGSRNTNVYLLRLSKEGDSLWGKELGHGDAYALESTINHDFIITGWDTAVLFIKASKNGDLLFHKNIYMFPPGTIGHTEGWSIKPTQDSGYIIGGRYVWGDSWLIYCRINSDGELIWSKEFTYFSSVCYSIDCTSDSGYILGGIRGSDALIIKTNINGDTLWANWVISPLISQFIYGIIQCNDDSYIACGGSDNNLGSQNILLMKISPGGSIKWSKNLLSGVYLFGNSVCQTSDNGFIICGAIRENDSSSVDVILVKTDTSGEVTWIKNVLKPHMLSVYPNPTHASITIEKYENTTTADIELFDLTGKCVTKVKLESIKDAVTIYVGSLKSGTYLLKISDNNKIYLIKKIIKI